MKVMKWVVILHIIIGVTRHRIMVATLINGWGEGTIILSHKFRNQKSAVRNEMAKPRRKAREEDSTMVEVPRLFGDSAIDPVGDPSDSPAGDPAGDPVGDPAICMWTMRFKQ